MTGEQNIKEYIQDGYIPKKMKNGEYVLVKGVHTLKINEHLYNYANNYITNK